jgi:hypothetical protein
MHFQTLRANPAGGCAVVKSLHWQDCPLLLSLKTHTACPRRWCTACTKDTYALKHPATTCPLLQKCLDCQADVPLAYVLVFCT